MQRQRNSVVLQGHEGGVPVLALSGTGARGGVPEVTAPERCVEGWVGTVQEKGVRQKHMLGQRGDNGFGDRNNTHGVLLAA